MKARKKKKIHITKFFQTMVLTVVLGVCGVETVAPHVELRFANGDRICQQSPKPEDRISHCWLSQV